MKLKYIFYDDFKFWISELSNEGKNPRNAEYYCCQMRERDDWFEEIEIKQSEINQALFTFLDLGDNAELEGGNVKRGAFTYTVYKLIGGWQLLDAGMSIADLPLNNGDFLLIDSSFKPSRGVIGTPRPLFLPKSFSSYVEDFAHSTSYIPSVQVCYTIESESVGLHFRNNPDLLEKIEIAGFSVSLDEINLQTPNGNHPYLLKDDEYKQLLFDALGWYNYAPKQISEYRNLNPHLSWLFNQGYSGFIKVVYSQYRNYDPGKYLYIGLDGDYQNTLQKLTNCIENNESYREQHLEELREIILDCIPYMKLEKTSSYHLMLEQILRQKTLGLMSEEEARSISHMEAHQQMSKVDLVNLFYDQCIKELGSKARILKA